MSPEHALRLLRNQPIEATENLGFVIAYDARSFVSPLGGCCQVVASRLSDTVFQLKAMRGTGDYFFPYANGMGPVGACQVPDGCSDGTLVLTGGMNGCALQVDKHRGYKMWYHDANGKQLAKRGTYGEAREGNAPLCRVEYDTYAGPLQLGRMSASRGKNPSVFQHTILSVKRGSRWLVVQTGILMPMMGSSPTTFRPTVSSLLTSFED